MSGEKKEGQEAKKKQKRLSEKQEALQKRYAQLAAKHELPVYTDLDKEFDLDAIDDEQHALLEVAKKIAETYDHYAKLVENVLQGEHSLVGMHEGGAFDEAAREKLIDLLKKLMQQFRSFQIAELDRSDESFAEYIKRSWAAWPELKKRLTTFLKRLAATWEHDEEFRPDVGYLG